MRRTAASLLWLVVASLVLVSLLPAFDTGLWFVRIWDFPRLQIAILAAAAAMLSLILFLWRRRTAHILAFVLAGSVCGWQSAHVLPYTRFWPRELPTAPPALADRQFRLVIANLRYDNGRHVAVEQTLRELDADMLLLIEIDERWAMALEDLANEYPHRVEEIRPEGLGLALWSRFPLQDPEVRELVTPLRPSIWTRVHGPAGQQFRFVGVHPTPPGLRRREGEGREDSRIRDAELVLVAHEVAQDQDGQWVVAGDFNDVAWSSTTELFRKLSGLLDPRVGRALLSTYHAELPLLRYPLDHVFVSHGFTVGEFRRERLPGSDHFTVIITLAPAYGKGPDPQAEEEDHEQASELLREGLQDADEQSDERTDGDAGGGP